MFYLKLSQHQSLTYFLQLKHVIVLKAFAYNPKRQKANYLIKMNMLNAKFYWPFCWLISKSLVKKLLMVCYFVIHPTSLGHSFIHSASLPFNKYLLSTDYIPSTVHIETAGACPVEAHWHTVLRSSSSKLPGKFALTETE